MLVRASIHRSPSVALSPLGSVLLQRRCACGEARDRAAACEACRRTEKPSHGGWPPASTGRHGHDLSWVRSASAPLHDGKNPTKQQTKCEEFPGGSTDCEVNPKTGIPTGRVTHVVEETSPCTKPCVERHEAVHVKQMKKFCPELRDCYLAADKGKRPIEECVRMGMFGGAKLECAAYEISVACMEDRLKNAKACRDPKNREYGTRKLASEKCFRDKTCAEEK